MSSIRIQLRRGTAAEWTAADEIGPGVVLADGEIGIETDTNRFKIGDGVSNWGDLTYSIVADDISTAIGDHNDLTQNVHGIADTSTLVTLSGSQTLSNKTLSSPSIEVPVKINGVSDTIYYASTIYIANGGTEETEQEIRYMMVTTPSPFSVGDIVTVTGMDQSAANVVEAEVTRVNGQEVSVFVGYAGALPQGVTAYNASGQTATMTEILDATATISSTEIAYLDGITSGVQSQLNAKASLTGSETLTNKTLTSPVINGGSISASIVSSIEEKVNVVASAATGTINIDALTASVWYYTSNASANFTLNFRGNASTSINNLLAVGDSITVVFMNTNGTTPYYPTAYQIDGSAVTPKWQGGTAPTSGNASSTDAYTITIIKTAATPTYFVMASQTRFA